MSKKHALELHHAGGGKEQRLIVDGHKRAARPDRVVLSFEVLEEFRTDFGGLHGSKYSRTYGG